jgi:squalene-associated FAD-dependent desaturase
MGGGAQPRGGGGVRRPRAFVVGGGLAGIAAALELADHGVEVTLSEVRPRLGGAAYSFERDGLQIDNGQHVFLRCCTEYRRLLERIGSSGDAVLQPRLSIPVLTPGGRRQKLYRGALPAPLHLAPALLRYGALSVAERVHAARTALALKRLDRSDPALDDVTFGDWLRDRGESDPAIASMWDLIALPTLNVRAADASLSLAAMVFQVGLLSDAAAGDIGYAAVPLSHLHGDPAHRALRSAGVEIRLRNRVERVVCADNRFEVVCDDETVAAETVVVAVQHLRAAEMLPPGALDDPDALERLGTSPIVNLHIAYDRRVTELPFAAAVGSPVQYLFDRTASSGVRAGQCLAISLSGADEEMRLSPERLRERFLPALEELLPAARGARVERFVVTKEHAATFRATPGVDKLRPPAATRIPGLLLAGAWTATGWPATMEGAARSGLTAAREAIATLESSGRRPKVPA